MNAPARMRRTALLAGSALAAVALAASPATAQQGAAVAASSAPASEASDVIVVTATRTQLSNFDYPGLTSAIELEALTQERPADLAELLQDIPGLQVAGGPRRTGQTLNLRGFGRESVTLLVDGARRNFNSAHDGVLFLDPALLRRVETVRGAASALYGSGAAGGVLAFETVEAEDLLGEDETFGARLSAGYRSVNEEARGSAAVFGEGETVEGIAAISLRSSGDIELGSGDALPADDEIVSGLATVEFDLTDAVELEFGWNTFRNDAVEPNNGQGASGVSSLNPLVDKEVKSDSYRATLEFEPDTDLIDLQITAYHNVGEVDETDPSIGRFIERDLTTDGVRLENRAEFSLGGAEAALVTGAEWYEDEQVGFDSTAPGNVRGGVPTGTTEFTAAYAQLETVIDAGGLGEIVLLPGVRFDEFETTSDVAASNADDAVSARFAASWAPNETFRLFASWGEAFRAPSLNELYLSGPHFSLPHPVLGPPRFITNDFIPNPNLKPEESETIEVGAAFRTGGVFATGDSLEIKGAVFQTEATDLINLEVDFAFDPTCFAPPFFLPCSAGTAFSENLASAELEGFEIAAAYTNGPLRLSGALYEVDGEDQTTGEPLGALQPLTGHINASYAFEGAGVDLGARLAFAGEFDKTDDPAEEREGYAVLDLYTGWRPFEDRRVRVDLGVDNVFNEDYERVFAGVSEPGRTFRIDLTWTGGF